METTKYLNECRTLDEVKRHYKQLALMYHPDRGGNTATMQEINRQYTLLIKDPFYNFAAQSEAAKTDFLKFPEIIEKIVMLNLTIEICGNWIWLSGNTFPYREYLLKSGFYWAPQKMMWYWRPSDYKSHSRQPQSMDYIRSKFGSDLVQSKFSSRAVSEESNKQF